MIEPPRDRRDHMDVLHDSKFFESANNPKVEDRSPKPASGKSKTDPEERSALILQCVAHSVLPSLY